METEGVVDVLRHVYETLAPGGVIVDVRSVPPPALVEVDGEPFGELDESAFFPRTIHNGAALDALAREGLLVPEGEIAHDLVIVYPSGPDLVEDVAGWGDTRVPAELAARLADVQRECRIREFCLARSFLRPA
jgi:hypothetical protein